MFQFINIAHAGVISDAPPLTSVGINVFNFLLSVVGIIAIIALVISGVMYLSAFGNEQTMGRAKKYFQSAVIGIIISMSGMVVVNFIGQFFR